MKDLLLVGGGGHCRSCIEVIEAEGRYRIRGIVKPKTDDADQTLGYSLSGTDDDLPILLQETSHALVTVGQIRSPEIRIRLFELLEKLGAKFPVVASPIAYCSKHAVISSGTIIMHGVIVNAGAYIGANCVINTKALIEHDAQIADHCHISTGARINGGVSIGRGSFIGSGAIVKEGVVIGENVVISAGQVILRDVPSSAVIKDVQ
jgi:sugar O-acyltransferase (sialic acid O-acetyltransferase NeuD family)